MQEQIHMYSDLYLIVLGLIVFVLGIYKLKKQQNKIDYDEETTGIVYDIDNGYPATNENAALLRSNITIRFLTKDNVWITEKVKDVTTPSLFKKGEEIKIRYNSTKPENFIISSSKQNNIYILFILIGVIIICYGILHHITTVSN